MVFTNNHFHQRGAGCRGQAVEHSAVKVWIPLHGGPILHGRSIGYFPSQPAVHNWSIKGCSMCCPVYGKLYIKDPLLHIRKNSPCGDSGFPLRKYVTMTLCLMSNSRWYEKSMCSQGVIKQNKLSFTREAWIFSHRKGSVVNATIK